MASGTIFTKTGTKEGYTALPSEKEILRGEVDGAVTLLPKRGTHPRLDAIVDGLHKYLGFMIPPGAASFGPPTKAPAQAPPAPGNYSGKVYVDPRITDGARAYANASRDVSRRLRVYEVPGTDLRDGIGCEEGGNAYINRDFSDLEKTVVLSHEGLASYVSAMTGISHDKLDKMGVIRRLEMPMVGAYERGEENVLDRFAKEAMKALRS